VGKYHQPRRKYLAALATTTVAGLAGCSSNETDSQGNLDREGADAMDADPISTHPDELVLTSSRLDGEWTTSDGPSVVLDSDNQYYDIPSDDNAIMTEVTVENSEEPISITTSATIFETSAAATSIFEGIVRAFDPEHTDHEYAVYEETEFGQEGIKYVIEADSEFSGYAEFRIENAIGGMSFFTDSDEPQSVADSMDRYLTQLDELIVDA